MKFDRLENQQLISQRDSSRSLEEILLKTLGLCNAAALVGFVYFSKGILIWPIQDKRAAAFWMGVAGLCLLNLILGSLALFFRRRWLAFERKLSCDDLTGLMNRIGFEQALEKEMRRAGRYHFPLTLCFLDLDHFTSFNEQFGRDRGNDLLKHFSNFLQGHARSSDILARSENDSFCVALPHTDLVRSEKFMSRLLIQAQEGKDISFSAGITSYQTGEGRKDFFSRAQLALNQAKREGKKRIRCIAGGQDNPTVLSF